MPLLELPQEVLLMTLEELFVGKIFIVKSPQQIEQAIENHSSSTDAITRNLNTYMRVASTCKALYKLSLTAAFKTGWFQYARSGSEFLYRFHPHGRIPCQHFENIGVGYGLAKHLMEDWKECMTAIPRVRQIRLCDELPRAIIVDPKGDDVATDIGKLLSCHDFFASEGISMHTQVTILYFDWLLPLSLVHSLEPLWTKTYQQAKLVITESRESKLYLSERFPERIAQELLAKCKDRSGVEIRLVRVSEGDKRITLLDSSDEPWDE